MFDKNSKISAFLFIRAYHRAIANDMTIAELAKKLKVSRKYISNRKLHLEQALNIKFPRLRHEKREQEEKRELRKMVASCQQLATRKLQQIQARSAAATQLV